MSGYRARHRKAPESLGSAKRAATTVSFGVLATAAVAGTSAAAWACPHGSHTQAHTRASVHHAVVHSHDSSGSGVSSHERSTHDAKPASSHAGTSGGTTRYVVIESRRDEQWRRRQAV